MSRKRERLVVVWAWGLLLGLGMFACSKQIGSGILASDSDGTKTLLFTGSSSIRMWKTVGADFPEFRTINTGFGGSQFSDLLRLQDSVIFKYTPDVFPSTKGTMTLLWARKPTGWRAMRRRSLPDPDETAQCPLVLIAPNPVLRVGTCVQSTSRRISGWRHWPIRTSRSFANVWPPMLDERQKNGDLSPPIRCI